MIGKKSYSINSERGLKNNGLNDDYFLFMEKYLKNLNGAEKGTLKTLITETCRYFYYKNENTQLGYIGKDNTFAKEKYCKDLIIPDINSDILKLRYDSAKQPYRCSKIQNYIFLSEYIIFERCTEMIQRLYKGLNPDSNEQNDLDQ